MLRIKSDSMYRDNIQTTIYEIESSLYRRDRTYDRYCPECGRKVCSYKDPTLKNAYCYSHDNLSPWSYQYIVGSKRIGERVKRHVDNWTGIGRGWHR